MYNPFKKQNKKEENELTVPVLAFEPIMDEVAEQLKDIVPAKVQLLFGCGWVTECTADMQGSRCDHFYLTNFGREAAININMRFRQDEKHMGTIDSVFSLFPKERMLVGFCVDREIKEEENYDIEITCKSVLGEWLRYDTDYTVCFDEENKSHIGLTLMPKITKIPTKEETVAYPRIEVLGKTIPLKPICIKKKEEVTRHDIFRP